MNSASKELQTRALAGTALKDRVVDILLGASEMLQKASTIQQAKLIADVAAAQQVYARRQQLGQEVEDYAHGLKIEALSRLGELLKELPKNRGAVGSIVTGSKREPLKDSTATLADLGVDKKTSAIAQQLAALPPETRQAIANREQKLSAVLMATRRADRAATVQQAAALPETKFRVIYADPPWSYNDKADAGAIQSGGAETHYPSMTIAQLCAMPVPSLCENDAVLFLWVTSPLLFECAPVIKAWGFTYKASFVWDKVKHNMGHYNSVRHEFLLLCTRGSCTPDEFKLFDSVQVIERTQHSAKPKEFRNIIDTLYPHGKRLELFAREQAPGWTVYGNQLRDERIRETA